MQGEQYCVFKKTFIILILLQIKINDLNHMHIDPKSFNKIQRMLGKKWKYTSSRLYNIFRTCTYTPAWLIVFTASLNFEINQPAIKRHLCRHVSYRLLLLNINRNILSWNWVWNWNWYSNLTWTSEILKELKNNCGTVERETAFF